jgi:hypothetical protein
LATVNVPDSLVDTEGLKVTVMVQLAPALTVLPQVLVVVKSAALVPVTETLFIIRADPVLFVRVTFWLALAVPTAELVKVRVAGEIVTVVGEPAAVAVPVSAIVWGDPAALSAMLTVDVRFPVAVGLNVTETVQLPDTATGVVQVLVCMKSPAFVPVSETLVMVSGELPLLVTVNIWAALADAVGWLENVTVD